MIRSGFVLICFGMCFSSRAGEPAKLDMTKEEQKLVELTNAERKKKDLPALKPSPLLWRRWESSPTKSNWCSAATDSCVTSSRPRATASSSC